PVSFSGLVSSSSCVLARLDSEARSWPGCVDCAAGDPPKPGQAQAIDPAPRLGETIGPRREKSRATLAPLHCLRIERWRLADGFVERERREDRVWRDAREQGDRPDCDPIRVVSDGSEQQLDWSRTEGTFEHV